MSKGYTETDITVLSDRDHVRLRVGIYFGSNQQTDIEVLSLTEGIEFKQYTIVPAAFKAVGEIIDNSIDEFAQVDKKSKKLSIIADPTAGKYTISDNGRGVPIGKHETGTYTPEVVFGSLRSGRNFTDERQQGVQGQNGVGSSCVCFSSTAFDISINRDGKEYQQKFMGGGSNIMPPKITKNSRKQTGTQISFMLDPDVFLSTQLPIELMQHRAIEIAMINPGIVVSYNNTKYQFKKGIEELVAKHTDQYFKFHYATKTATLEFFVIFNQHKNDDEKIFTYVNTSPLFDGGLCNVQFTNSFYSKVTSHLASNAKKQKIEVSKADIKHGIVIIGNIKTINPEYNSQSKIRFVGPSLKKEMDVLIDGMWSSFARKHKGWFDDVLERAYLRYNHATNKKIEKEMLGKRSKKVPNLTDANSKNRFECKLLITEGKSAASSIIEVRNPNDTGCFPLTGKINNVYNMSASQLLKAGKVTDLLLSIGLIPGKKALRSDLRFGKIIIATDADVDGDDIFTLLINLFYQFWPELFSTEYSEPIVYRLMAPNVVAVKNKKRIHFTTADEYEKVKHKYNNHTISYLKGLGSMIQEDFKQILSGDEYLVPIIDDGKLKNTLDLLFSPNIAARKEWLTHGK